MNKKSKWFKNTPSFLIVQRWVYSRLMGFSKEHATRKRVDEFGVVVHEKGPDACLPGRSYSFDNRKLYKRGAIFGLSVETIRRTARTLGVFRSVGYWGCRREVRIIKDKVHWEWVCYLSPDDTIFPTVYAGRSNIGKGKIARDVLLRRFIIEDSPAHIPKEHFDVARMEAAQLGVSQSLFCKVADDLGFKGRQGVDTRRNSGPAAFLDVVDQTKRLILMEIVRRHDWLKDRDNKFFLMDMLEWMRIDEKNIDALIVDAALAELVYESVLSSKLHSSINETPKGEIRDEKFESYTPVYCGAKPPIKIETLYLDKLGIGNLEEKTEC